ncbi:putative tubulin tyrosine ligase [Trypanosoma vivax]|uniref:Tubulin--tyrosine ligase-like protein 5 n=1 Tax=Trypanosoma vivax (strain Y486) TaxID=1055687 RepID=G0TR57_TRYVY|nr:putative tubulin-tyrosine ligase [Trypanosoma vivax]KAH8611548.1 putative tubulin tyrosine ligase [Trypanosoma vivax]CCC46421.1 putative tubulin-tyrosine ligase [Trypanosoma vivax Y486]
MPHTDDDQSENYHKLVCQQQQRNKVISRGAFDPGAPLTHRFDQHVVWENTTVQYTRQRSAAADEFVSLNTSPFSGRRSTISFRALDRPWDGDSRKDDKRVYVEPAPLVRVEDHREAAGNDNDGARLATSETNRSGPYATLRFVMSAAAVRFSAVMCTLERAGFVEETSLLSNSWLLKWCKHPVRSDFKKLKSFQRINHFPGTWRLGKKDELHKHLVAAKARWAAKMCDADSNVQNCKKVGVPTHSNVGVAAVQATFGDFFPDGWVLPEEKEEFMRVLCSHEECGNVFIAKPTTSACGRGIQLLVANGDKTQLHLHKKTDENAFARRTVVQRYVSDPMLIEGYKFDLRLYVVVTSYNPLRVYLYDEGLVRFATSPYPTEINVAAIDCDTGLTAHLTNFTINKKSEDFVAPSSLDEAGGQKATASKWTLGALREYFKANHLDWEGTMEQIHDLLIKVMLSVEPHVTEELTLLAAEVHRSEVKNCCFEIYGVDVLLRKPCPPRKSTPSPVLMEVNIMPSLSTHYSLLDQWVKANFVSDTLTLVGLGVGSTLRDRGPSASRTNEPIKAPQCSGAEGSTTGTTKYLHPFLDALTDEEEIEACLTLEEEHLRCRNFTKICPTPESYNRYKPLFSRPVGQGKEGARQRLDELLTLWEQARIDVPPQWCIKRVRNTVTRNVY